MIDALGHPQHVLALGGTSDIALAAVRRWAAAGPLTVSLAARPGRRRDEARAELEGLDVRVVELDFDAEDVDSHPGVVHRAAQEGDLDVVLVAFGVLEDGDESWQDHVVAVRQARVNYLGAVSVGVAVGEVLRAQGHGMIVFLSSVAGERVRRSNFSYGASKAGADGFYLGLGEALRDEGIGVLVVRPGFVHTKMTEGREAAPLSVSADEVAEAIVDGVTDRKELVWVPRTMRPVMSALRHVPRPLFRRLPI